MFRRVAAVPVTATLLLFAAIGLARAEPVIDLTQPTLRPIPIWYSRKHAKY